MIVYYDDDTAVGCGAFKKYDAKTVEIKRMFVDPEFRSKGIGAAILKELETWAVEVNNTASFLENGKKNNLKLSGYIKSPAMRSFQNFDPYLNVENSVCLQTSLI